MTTVRTKEVHLVCGSTSEAIRLAPVVLALRRAALLEPVLLADPAVEVLEAFGLTPEITLPAGDELVRELDELWSVRTPAAVIVVGDAGTTLAGALAAFWRRIPVVHLDAGLRSGDPAAPFPAEDDRRLLAQFATLHLVSSPLAAMNLMDERIPAADVLITGSTVIDAALLLPGHPVEAGDQVGDGLAGRRAAQATAALLGLATPPEPLPVSPAAPTPGVVA